MTFKKCSIRGHFFGDLTNDTSYQTTPVEFENPTENFVWYDRSLINSIERNDDKNVEQFFTLLALCHTVMTEERNGKIIYQAQSPDENALVSAARSFGYEFLVKRQTSSHKFNSNFILNI